MPTVVTENKQRQVFIDRCDEARSFCSICGRELVTETWGEEFDEQTGERILRLRKVCRRLVRVFGLFTIDRGHGAADWNWD